MSLTEQRTISLAAGERDIETHFKVRAAVAVGEIIFNAIDADAKMVRIDRKRDLPGGPVTEIVVTDDGHGIPPEKIEAALGTHRDSPKRLRRTSPEGRPLQGQQGRGRFRTLAISRSVEWLTTAKNGLDEIAVNRISISRSRATTVEVKPHHSETDAETGTVTTLRLLQDQKSAKAGDIEFRHDLEALIAPVLASLTDLEIYLDDEMLDPLSQMENKASIDIEVDLTGFETDDEAAPDKPVIDVYEWGSSAVARAIYLCDENGSAVAELERKGLPKVPAIAWTAHLRWNVFGRESVTEGDLQSAASTFEPVISEALRVLRSHLNERADEVTGDAVEEWISDGSYPYGDAPETPAAVVEQETFREMVGIARQALPQEHSQRKLALGMMKAAFQESPNDALSVIEQVKNLDEDEIREFRELLDQTSLSKVVRASKVLADRIVFLTALKELVYGEGFKPVFLERDHLHKLLDQNPWVFGNQWALARSEASLNTVLREHLPALRPEAEVLEPSSADRRVDMLLSGANREHGRTRRLVVELKRASIRLRRKERDQIEDYARLLANSARFAGQQVVWDFWLIGSEIHNEIIDSVRQADKPAGLLQEVHIEGGSSYRIWVKSWSEVISSAEEGIAFFKTELDYDPGAVEAIELLREKYPDNIPKLGQRN